MIKEQPFTEISDQNRKLSSAVYMEKLSSVEHYLEIGHNPRPVLQSISIEIMKGEIWAITGNNKYEMKLLLEIMANIKPYYNGRCVLMERGMMRHKRVILPHIFYIGNTNMAYNNMNVLEYLMFSTANSSSDVVSQQERIFEQLISFGLGNISLTPISTLTPEYKALVLLIVAIYSLSQLLVFNLPALVFNEAQVTALINIKKYIRSSEQTLVISTLDPLLIERICDHTAFLYNGKLIFQGTTEEFRYKYDRIVLTIKDKNAQNLKERLINALPLYKYDIQDQVITVRNYSADNNNARQIYEEVVAAGFAPDKIRINPKTVKNACEEIIKQYDLQE
ncbi:MAG: hypothetical protein CVU97_02175 [Firmicutes bacterium HGW-Firmicutes-21]|nr:MAG: hypothetical protein CVU97_02175 [Firmicutes bacterium HGW-Firmicutes-21]